MRRGLTSVASVVAALAAATAINAPAAADDDAVTWMVRPSDGVGEDGRSWIELELAPGERVEEHLMVRNLSPAAVTFRLTAADGYFTDGGGFNMLTADDESVGAGTWITIPESVEVESGQAAIVPFTVEAPDNATPGDHAAGVAASIRTGGDDVGIESRVGFRVLTRVKGELAPRVEASVGGGYEGAANPFKPGRVEVAYTLADAGNTRLSIQPDVRVSAIFGLVSFSAPGDAVAEIGPGQSRTGSVEIPAAWPLGVYSVEVTANASTVGAGAAPEPVAPARATATVVAIPWPQMAVLALAALIAWWWRRDHRRREAKVARLVAEARLAGRAESASGAAPITRRTLAGACALVAAGALAIGPAGAASAVPDDPNRRGSVLIRVYVAPEAPAPSPPPDQDGLAGTGARVAGLALGALGGVGLGLAIGAARRRSSGTA